MTMYALLDVFFVVFHSVLVLFNLVGWAWRRTRRVHLITIGLTVLSWFGLGVFFGWGYCPCTDWHWQVKRALGERNLPNSYIKYYLDRLSGVDWDPAVVDFLVVATTLAALGLSVWLNGRDFRRECRKAADEEI
jgi:hypothetical protein